MNRLIAPLAVAAVLTVTAAFVVDTMFMDMPMAPGGVMKMIDPMPGVYMGTADKPGAPLFKGLGTFHHKINSRNKLAQRYFDQGIKLTFGFNHAEAMRSFREAVRLDPHCAMCWWGWANALAPNIILLIPYYAVNPSCTALYNALVLKQYAAPGGRGGGGARARAQRPRGPPAPAPAPRPPGARPPRPAPRRPPPRPP